MIITAETAGSFLQCLFQCHTLFYFFKVVSSVLCVALLQFSTAARQIVGRIRKRDLHICVDHMVETQIFIDVGSRNLACTDGLDRKSVV